VRYAGNRIAEAQGKKDFGGGRQQGANLHSGSLTHAFRGCEAGGEQEDRTMPAPTLRSLCY